MTGVNVTEDQEYVIKKAMMTGRINGGKVSGNDSEQYRKT